jgi:hypothetical protein
MRRLWRLLRVYWRQVARTWRKPNHAGPLLLLRSLPAWLRSQGRSGLDDQYPWITFEASRRIERVLTPDSRVFEYGTGGSTLFLSARAGRVVSVENDPEWFEVVRGALAGRTNVEVLLEPGVPASEPEDAAFASRSERFSNLTFGDYVRTIDRFPDGHFDLLLVDGRARPAAFFRGQRKVRIGGTIVLDDSSRSGYASVVEAARAAGWPAFGHYGPKPYTRLFAETTVWTKTSNLGG